MAEIVRQPDGQLTQYQPGDTAITDADIAAYVALYGPPGVGPGFSLAGYTTDGEPVWRMNYASEIRE